MTTPSTLTQSHAEKLPPHGLIKSTAAFPKLQSNQAVIQEVFSSIQGEGLHAGQRQVFVRVAHCHLHCAYCDTPMTTARGDCAVETLPGSNQWVAVPGLQRVEDTEMLIAGLIAQAPHHSVSFTGGEPLLYPYYLKSLMQRIQRLGVKTYLETSGTQPHSLAKVLAFTDVISMDVKLPSSTKEAERWQQHADFYRTAKQAPHIELFVKVVVNHHSSLEELMHLTSIITEVDTPLFLQPESSLTEAGVINISPSHLLHLQAGLARYFSSVRVLPQTHKMMKIS
jgi:7-carboxy-7-deazaguanine synthase